MTITRATGLDLIKEYKRDHGEQTLLAFSTGKDSLSAALAIRDHLEVIPMYYYIIPDLPLVNEALDYFERKLFKRRILRFPDYRLLQWLDTGAYQTMKTMQIIDAAGGITRPANFTAHIKNIHRWAIEQEGLDRRTLTAVGIRQDDSPRRRMSFHRYGAIRPSAVSWMPVWNFNKAAIIDLIDKSGISLPKDYLMFGKSFDGRLTPQFLGPIRKHRPKDWEVICTWFPHVPVELWKYERAHGSI